MSYNQVSLLNPLTSLSYVPVMVPTDPIFLFAVFDATVTFAETPQIGPGTVIKGVSMGAG